MMIRRVSCLLSGLALFIIAGCAARAPQEPILWPPLPDEPRIAYVGSYRGQADLEQPGFLDLLFGHTVEIDFSKPYGVFAQGGNIYVTDTTDGSVVVLDLTKRETRAITGASASIQVPLGVAVSKDGSIYVSDAQEGKVVILGADGRYKAAIGRKKGELIRPSGLAINDKLGRLYVADSEAHVVLVYTLQGERLFSIGKPGEGDGQFHNPTNLAIDRRTGDVIVGDTSNFRVQIFDQDGRFKSKFGELGDTFGSFARPKGVGIDSEGHIYVADAAFNNFQVFTHDGELLTYVGTGGHGPAMFQLPAGLYVDEEDRIYVVDQMNSRVQVFQFLSEKWKKAHPEEFKKYLQPAAASARNDAAQRDVPSETH